MLQIPVPAEEEEVQVKFEASSPKIESIEFFGTEVDTQPVTSSKDMKETSASNSTSQVWYGKHIICFLIKLLC